MSNLVIEVVNVSVATVPTAKGSYQVADVAYKNKSFQDKLEGKKVMDFSNKGVFTILSNAKFGDVFDVTRVKNEKGFWDWTALGNDTSSNNQSIGADSSMGNTTGVSSTSTTNVKAGNAAPRSNYETPEERAARQVLIVRQSSLSNAMDYAVANKIKDEAEILAMATRFHDWVFGINTLGSAESSSPSTFDDFDSDVLL